MKRIIYCEGIIPSEDEKIQNFIESIIQIFETLSLDYTVIGSVGIQSFYQYFFKLPNDLDIVIRKEDICFMKEIANQRGFQVVDEIYKITINTNVIPIHLLPGELCIFNKQNDYVYGKVDLNEYLINPRVNSINFLASPNPTSIKVFPIEINLYLELLRPIYTGSIYNLYFIFRYLQIDDRLFGYLMKKNNVFSELIVNRLRGYYERMILLTYNEKKDVQFVQDRIQLLLNKI